MYNTRMLILLLVHLFALNFMSNSNLIYGQQNNLNRETVTDFDGNVYNTVIIGNQIWTAENLKSTHYSDGTPIENFVYSNDTSNVNIYGRLYRWDAAMRNGSSSNSNPSNIQGASPEGWHIPSEAEWLELIDFLGGELIAGGKLKETGFEHWNYPNTGASNEVGFSALATGWFDFTGEFIGIGEKCFFRTSTAPNPNATYTRQLTRNTSSITRATLHPDDAIPIRCIKNDTGTGIIDKNKSENIESLQINQNYPNPFNPTTDIQYSMLKGGHIKIDVYNYLGQNVAELLNEYKQAGDYIVKFDGSNLSSGVYLYMIEATGFYQTRKMILLR